MIGFISIFCSGCASSFSTLRTADPALKPGTINEIFQKYRGDKHIHPHSMRHACAVHMIKNGAGLRDVQVLLGHKSIKSTVTYTVLTANDLKDLHTRFHPRERMYSSDDKLKEIALCHR